MRGLVNPFPHPLVVISVLIGNVDAEYRTGGQIGNNDSADDVKNVDLTRVHYLSGPFEIEGYNFKLVFSVFRPGS